MKARSIPAAALAAFALALAAPAAAPARAGGEAPASAREEALSTVIDRGLRSGGSWFTAEERALIERKCGYAPGEWDGFEANLSDGTFICRDGRRVEDAEMRALLRAAAPRIEARVEAVMKRADVTAAIARAAEAAAAEALLGMEARRRR
ncbi:MAG TPA: hypothetical protein VD846_09955 [Allosphingosinicella sp.]|nr:hypothetical protein [Allosphingosinicella sp.]